MTCPACGGELVEGGVRCPVCDVPVAPRVEGALAADPRLVTPPARGRARVEASAGEPVREIPGQRRETRQAQDAWREEVRNRVRSRRQKRADAGLPLFDDVAEPAAPPAAPTHRHSPAAPADAGEVELKRPEVPIEARALEPPPAAPAALPVAAATQPLHRAEERRETALPPPASAPAPAEGDLVSPGLSEAELADLPLRATAPPALSGHGDAPGLAEPAVPAASNRSRGRTARLAPIAPPSIEDEILLGEVEPEIALEPPQPGLSPVERPARALERTQAAAVDLAVFTVLGAVVVYFAGRAARVEATSLAAAWPWLVSFLGLLAVFYAGYFTGTTGQTPGKLLTGLRVVGSSGRPPGYPRAAGRAVAGFVGVLSAGAGLLPILFDPARRALHDRLFRTRVVRR